MLAYMTIANTLYYFYYFSASYMKVSLTDDIFIFPFYISYKCVECAKEVMSCSSSYSNTFLLGDL